MKCLSTVLIFLNILLKHFSYTNLKENFHILHKPKKVKIVSKKKKYLSLFGNLINLLDHKFIV